LVHISNM